MQEKYVSVRPSVLDPVFTFFFFEELTVLSLPRRTPELNLFWTLRSSTGKRRPFQRITCPFSSWNLPSLIAQSVSKAAAKTPLSEVRMRSALEIRNR